jgi:hypothetical protein
MPTNAGPPPPYEMPVRVVNDTSSPVSVTVEKQETFVRERLNKITEDPAPHVVSEGYTVPEGYRFRLQYVAVYAAAEVDELDIEYRPTVNLQVGFHGYSIYNFILGLAEYGSLDHFIPASRDILFAKNVDLNFKSGESIYISYHLCHPGAQHGIEYEHFLATISGILEPTQP